MYARIASAIAALVIFGFVYFFLANTYVYHRIHAGNLIFPAINASYDFPGPGQELTYIALGDSLTASVGTNTYVESYPYQVAQKLSSTHATKLISLAYPGFRSKDLLAQYVDTAVRQDPQIVTILIGTNDIHGRVPVSQFEKTYRTMLEKLSRSDARIYLISIPYIGSNTLYFPILHSYFDYRTRQFNNSIQALATQYGATYIDIATPTRDLFKKDGLQYASDSFHPSAVGYKLWADIMYAAINP